MKQYQNPRKAIPESVKMQIRIEARHSCAICGNSSTLEFHHIDENRENNSLDNIILLCRNHHGEFHKGYIKKNELIEYKKNLTANFVKQDELKFYLKKIQSTTEKLFLEQWDGINEMIGTNHEIYINVCDSFDGFADEICRTQFPNGIYSELNKIFSDLAEKICKLIEVFKCCVHVEMDKNKFYLSRKWKGLKQYSQDEYFYLNEIDVDFEHQLFDAYDEVCINLLKFQEYIWEKIDFNYLDRIRIKADFYSYYSQ